MALSIKNLWSKIVGSSTDCPEVIHKMIHDYHNSGLHGNQKNNHYQSVTHFFLCSTVSSFAASPKSPSLNSILSLTKKLPTEQVTKVSSSHFKVTTSQTRANTNTHIHAWWTYPIWDLCEGCLCCAGISVQIWSALGNSGPQDRSKCASPSIYEPGTAEAKRGNPWLFWYIFTHQGTNVAHCCKDIPSYCIAPERCKCFLHLQNDERISPHACVVRFCGVLFRL